MHPRQKALRKGSVAPPSGSKVTAFNRFKEASFRHAISLAQKLHAKGWGAIVGSQKVKERLEAEGVANVVYEPGVANRNEIILNRSRDKSESNFFVFVKFGTLRAAAFFTDPSHGNEGRKLKRKELMRKRSAWRAKNRDWVGETAEEILEVEEKKAKCKFFAVVHGHWGENKDHGRHRDDGVSLRKDVIRQFMLWHYDVDATGYHNWIHREAIEDISAREANVGITKVPSLEFTMPFNEGAENGPHLNFWFSDLDAAERFWRYFIFGFKHNVMPGLAPSVRDYEVLDYTDMLRETGRMAVGVAHPSCILNVPMNRKGLPVGLINLLNERDRKGRPTHNWQAIWDFVEGHCDAVGLFNPTIDDLPLHFQEKNTEDYFGRKVEVLVGGHMGGGNGADETGAMRTGIDAQLGGGVRMTEHTVSYAFARRMREKFGKLLYFDHDLHKYGKMRYRMFVGPLAYGRTVFRLNGEGMGKLRDGAMGGKDFIEIMHKKTFRGSGVEADTETFLELDGGKLRPVAPRRDILYDYRNIGSTLSHWALTAKLAWRDLKKRLSRSITTKA